ncbi:apoptosis-resistant E3 ubiquitin protein ligase 1-like [Ylistrum balloti]|uniref:apoptosis-resistant E3 ubiquitin protein ligase 1-like n=1 Tax=Ylistrum balloti TaxID=509963 RepID=UPI002905BEFC|nr:apoptosis-resistant E3 ubiquitin protein ligase 1-like [Ylistrum balloti]
MPPRRGVPVGRGTPFIIIIEVLITIAILFKDMMMWIHATLRRISADAPVIALGVFIIGTVLHISLQTVPPESSSKVDIWNWMDKNGLKQYNNVFTEQGVETTKDILSMELEKIPEFSSLPPDQQHELRNAFNALKEETYLQILLEKNKIPASIFDRLKARGVVSLQTLSHLSDRVIQTITETDNTLTDFQNLKHCVTHARDYIDNRDELYLYSQVGRDFDSPVTPFVMKAFKIALTLLLGSFLLILFIMFECVRSVFHRRPYVPSSGSVSPFHWRPRLPSSRSVAPITPSLAVQNSDKGWLWNIIWGTNVSAQYCVVQWGWTSPHGVGNTMSFTVQLFRKNGKPYVIVNEDTSNIIVEILHRGIKVACTKQQDKEGGKSNTVRVSFTVHRSGPYKISVMVSGKHIKDSPFTREFDAGPIDASRTGFTNYCSTIVCTPGTPYPLTIETQDSFGNPAVYKADQNHYFKIKVIETESQTKYMPVTQLVNMPDKKQLNMRITMCREGCYQASVSYGDMKLRNGDFNILVINSEDMACVKKNMARKTHSIWYEARLLQGNPSSEEKAKKVYVYISPKQLTLKEYYLKIIGKKLFTWRVCPSTKFYFSGHNTRYDLPVMTIYDCCQPPVILATKERSVIAATFTNFLLRNIGGSETFQDKHAYFVQEVRKLQKRGNVTLKIDRSNFLYSSYKATKNFDTSDWYKTFHIVFVGEPGLDWGGLRREWFEMLCTELFDPSRSGLYTRFTEDSQGLVHPTPTCRRKQELKLKYYEFAGKVVGKCLYDSALGSAYRQLVKARFSRSFLAQLIGLQVNYKYFETDDPELYKTKVQFIDENDIDDMELSFSEEEYSDGQLQRVVDLVPGGSSKPVTNENKQHYLNCLAQYKLSSSMKDEADHFLKGLNVLIPDTLLSIFDENELELLMCGTGNYSITDFKAHAVIEGSSYHFFKVLDWFWTVIASFTEEQMARLLQFTTGCSQLPPQGFAELNPKFQISFSPTYNTLPTAHTCFNQLCLPDYDSIDSFHRSLLIAINEGAQGFGLV